MRYAARALFFTVFLTVSVFAMAEEGVAPSIKAGISKKRIFVGDRIRYKTEIVSKDDLEIEFPQFKNSKIGDCEIKDSGRSVKKSIFGKNSYVNRMDRTSYDVGKRTVPPIESK